MVHNWMDDPLWSMKPSRWLPVKTEAVEEVATEVVAADLVEAIVAVVQEVDTVAEVVDDGMTEVVAADLTDVITAETIVEDAIGKSLFEFKKKNHPGETLGGFLMAII